MNPDTDDFVTIRPRPAPVSTDRTQSTPTAAPRNLRSLGFGLGVAALSLLGIWVFFFLPERVAVVETPAGGAPTVSARRDDAAPAPFEAIRFEQERKAAQALLSRFVELQIKLDDEMQVSRWAPEAFAAAQQLANDGDQ